MIPLNSTSAKIQIWGEKMKLHFRCRTLNSTSAKIQIIPESF